MTICSGWLTAATVAAVLVAGLMSATVAEATTPTAPTRTPGAPPECPPGYFWHEQMGHCMPLGDLTPTPSDTPECPPGYFWHEEMGHCMSLGKLTPTSSDTPECPPGYFWHEEMGHCMSLGKLTPTPAATSSPPPPSPSPTEVPPGGGRVEVSVSDNAPRVRDAVQLSVTVTDDRGNPVAGVECTFAIMSQPGSDAALGAESATTDDNGVAAVRLSTGGMPGTIQVTADCGAYGSEVLDVVVSPAGLPSNGAGGSERSSRARPLAIALAALAATAAVGAASFARRRP